jgi:hypothetical protein
MNGHYLTRLFPESAQEQNQKNDIELVFNLAMQAIMLINVVYIYW